MTDEQFRTPSTDNVPDEQPSDLEEPSESDNPRQLDESGEDDPAEAAEPTTEEKA